jgi:hypothetical protein
MKQRIILLPANQRFPTFWPWLISLGLLGLALGGFWRFSQSERFAHIVGNPRSDGILPITEISEIVDEHVNLNLLGRPVSFDRVYVTKVEGDFVFFASDHSDAAEQDAVPVVLMAERTGRQAEQRIELEAGDAIAIYGQIRRMKPSTFAGDALLTTREREQILKFPVYISAQRVIQKPSQSDVAD